MKQKRSLKIILSISLIAIVILIVLGLTSRPYIGYQLSLSKLKGELSKYHPEELIFVFDPDFPGEIKLDLVGEHTNFGIKPFAVVSNEWGEGLQMEFSDGTRKLFNNEHNDLKSTEARIFAQAINYLNLYGGSRKGTLVCFSQSLHPETVSRISAMNYKKCSFFIVTFGSMGHPKKQPMKDLSKNNKVEFFSLEILDRMKE